MRVAEHKMEYVHGRFGTSFEKLRAVEGWAKLFQSRYIISLCHTIVLIAFFLLSPCVIFPVAPLAVTALASKAS